MSQDAILYPLQGMLCEDLRYNPSLECMSLFVDTAHGVLSVDAGTHDSVSVVLADV
jgi:hypothetical protein